MNRIEFGKIFKAFLLSALCALPIVIILDLLIKEHVSMAVMTTLDVIVFIVAGFLGYLLYTKRQEYIAKKREEIKKKKQNKE